MKRFLLMIMILFLSACSAKTVVWKDVEDRFSEIEETAIPFDEGSESFYKEDYQSVLIEMKDLVSSLVSGIDKEQIQQTEKLYQLAVSLKKTVSVYDSESSSILSELSDQVIDLIKAAYGKNDDFADLQSSALNCIDSLNNWEDEMWTSIEKRKLLSWEDVFEEYEQLAADAREDLTAFRDVTEDELQQLNRIIVNGYKSIANGISEKEKEIADEIYSSAVKLQEYTRNINGDAPDKVFYFAKHALEYVENCYGKPIEDPDYDFPNEVLSAEKWTLSLWNQITALLKR